MGGVLGFCDGRTVDAALSLGGIAAKMSEFANQFLLAAVSGWLRAAAVNDRSEVRSLTASGAPKMKEPGCPGSSECH